MHSYASVMHAHAPVRIHTPRLRIQMSIFNTDIAESYENIKCKTTTTNTITLRIVFFFVCVFAAGEVPSSEAAVAQHPSTEEVEVDSEAGQGGINSQGNNPNSI